MPKTDTRNKIGDNTICLGVYVPKITHAQLVAIAKEKELTLSVLFVPRYEHTSTKKKVARSKIMNIINQTNDNLKRIHA